MTEAHRPTEQEVEWVAGYVLDFMEGDSEARVLHTGSLESCENMRRLMPAIAYSGDQRVSGAHSFVMRKSDWETL